MDFHELGEMAAISDTLDIAPVEGRVLQLDADFSCYECTDVETHLSYNISDLKKLIEHRRKAAQAETVNVHITIGLKSGRHEMATVKEYQAQRKKDPRVRARVNELRKFLETYETDKVKPVVSKFYEADDTISISQLTRIAEHGIDSSIIDSGDKDLWMVDGLHINSKTGHIWCADGYGVTEYRDVGNVKPKLVGEGKSWFWHQIMMGDTADNIPGLEQLTKSLCARYGARNGRGCGEKKAVAVLSGVTDEREAARRVYEAFREHYNSDEQFVEQAFLLWMRRTTKINDVILYLNECGLPVQFSAEQVQRLKEYQGKCK